MLDRLLAQRFIVAQLVEVVEVTAGRKRPARTGDHRCPRAGVLVDLAPHLGQAHVQVVVDRVELVGPVQRDDPQRSVGLDVDFAWQVVHLAHDS